MIHRNPLNGPRGSKTNRWINKVCHMHATDMLTARERRALPLRDPLAGPHKHQVNGESQTHKSHRGIPQVWDWSRLRRTRRGARVTSACPLWSHRRVHFMTIHQAPHVRSGCPSPSVSDVNRTGLFKNHRLCGHRCSCDIDLLYQY